MKYLPLLWAGLWRKPIRTTFTLLSILVAFLLFGLLQGVNSAFERSIADTDADRLMVESRIAFGESLPYAYLSQIDSMKGVKNVAFGTLFMAQYQQPRNVVVALPTDPQRYFAVSPELTIAPDQLNSFINTRTGAVVPDDMAKVFGWRIGDRLPLQSTNWANQDGSPNWAFNIVGVYHDSKGVTNGDAILFNHSYFDEARGIDKGRVGWYIVQVADPHQAAEVSSAIDKLFANSSDETRTMTESEFEQAFMKQVGDINFIVVAIVGSVFFTLLFLTGNTMMQSVRERVPEFAVLKTLGFTENQVLMLVLTEALALCVLAAFAGIGLATLAFPAMKHVIGTATLPTNVVLIGAALAILLAFLVSLPPAISTRRLSIVDALAGRR